MLRPRQAWFDGQRDLDPERLVFIDETWTATNMARSHGRCAKGERLRMIFSSLVIVSSPRSDTSTSTLGDDTPTTPTCQI